MRNQTNTYAFKSLIVGSGESPEEILVMAEKSGSLSRLNLSLFWLKSAVTCNPHLWPQKIAAGEFPTISSCI